MKAGPFTRNLAFHQPQVPIQEDLLYKNETPPPGFYQVPGRLGCAGKKSKFKNTARQLQSARRHGHRART